MIFRYRPDSHMKPIKRKTIYLLVGKKENTDEILKIPVNKIVVDNGKIPDFSSKKAKLVTAKLLRRLWFVQQYLKKYK